MYELMVINNGMEGFHHTVKTQMRNNHPNFAAFTDIIAWVECLRKADYDNE